MNDEYGYVKFLGDYSKLKSMGFTFQKLYAGNYMQWEKDHFRVWKKGSDITHDRYNLFKLIRFLETTPLLKKHEFRGGKVSYSFFKFYINVDENVYDYFPHNEENSNRYTEYLSDMSAYIKDKTLPRPAYLGDWEWVDQKTIDFIKELKDMGWYELDYYPED
jgi:hypothetical protein